MRKKQTEENTKLQACRYELRKEKQKNRDMQKSRDKYRGKVQVLTEQLREEERLKKTGNQSLCSSIY